MANKFRQSILDRLEQDVIRQKQAKKTTDEEITPVDKIAEPETPKASIADMANKTKLNEFLAVTGGRTAKNKTFYLDLDVIEAVKTASANLGVNDSKLVNGILRKVFELA